MNYAINTICRPYASSNTSFEILRSDALAARHGLSLIDSIVDGCILNPVITRAALNEQCEALKNLLRAEQRFIFPFLDKLVPLDDPLRPTLDVAIRRARRRRKKWLNIYVAAANLLNPTVSASGRDLDMKLTIRNLPALKWHLTTFASVVIPLAKIYVPIRILTLGSRPTTEIL